MEKTHLYAYISFTSKDDSNHFPTEVVTEMLGVEPTTIFQMGERINDVRTRSFTSWNYESDTLETLDVDDVLLPILVVFKDKTDSINLVKEKLNLYTIIRLVITMIDGQTPGLVISPEFSQFASAINAFIDIDMYVYPFSEPEE